MLYTAVQFFECACLDTYQTRLNVLYVADEKTRALAQLSLTQHTLTCVRNLFRNHERTYVRRTHRIFETRPYQPRL